MSYLFKQLLDILGGDAMVLELDTSSLLEKGEEALAEVLLLGLCSEEQGHVEGISVDGGHCCGCECKDGCEEE